MLFYAFSYYVNLISCRRFSASRLGGKYQHELSCMSDSSNCKHPLRRVSNADVVLFVNSPVPERHTRIAEETGVSCTSRASKAAVHFLTKLLFFFCSVVIPFDLNQVQPSFMQKFHPSTLRWPLFHAYFQVPGVQSNPSVDNNNYL